MAKVLIADDEMTMVQMITELLRSEGHEVSAFTTGAAALSALEENPPDLVITDLYLDKTRAHGLEILARSRALNPPAVVIMITGFGTVETAVEAMKKGAFDYLEKPFKLDELRLCVERAVSYRTAMAENIYLRKQIKQKYQFDQLVGTSNKMQAVFKLIERVADTDSTILILGESGTGKELVARALHFNSKRQYGQFVPVNCSALPESLLESELFGHKKGSFTGAISDKKGLFQEADGGTIFLDEIGSMSPLLQSRLLRVLQEREIRRVGDSTPLYVNVRVVAATNELLEKRIKEGKFREDLYYRLNVIPIGLPRLVERRDDIPLLIAHFFKNKMSARTGKNYQVTRQAMELLCGYDWPGNVRELENAIERACAMCEGDVIHPADLPPALLLAKSIGSHGHEDSDVDAHHHGNGNGNGNGDGLYPLSHSDGAATRLPAGGHRSLSVGEPLKNFIREQEIAYVNAALQQTGGDKEKAAELLGVSLATLYRKLAEPAESV
ncbi:MAG: sigma-54-dependent Fis family transcriptional regulator [Verrucomicrobia bacterium]|nr:sigma-54-dependent Fis family transcriptional regulator [Verrucomicrobiota bacterium]